MVDPNIAIELKQISKAFPKSGVVLNNFELQVRRGEFLSLVGQSGSGKTTVLRLIALLLPPDSGTVKFTATRIPGDISYVFQEPSLLPWLTVEKNISLPLELLGRRDWNERSSSAMNLVGLTAARDHLPRELSGGMKMRVALARALVTDPKFILLDEPFASLDEITRLELEEELAEIAHRSKMTAILVTHSLSEAVFLSDRVVLLGSGIHGAIRNQCDVGVTRPRSSAFRMTPEYSQIVANVRSGLGSVGEGT